MGNTKENMSWFEYTLLKAPGDCTAVISLLCDNLVNLVTLQGLITGVGAAESFVTQRLYFSSLIGVVLGNAAIFGLDSWIYPGRFKAAIPFGIDAPSIFFIGIAVAGVYTSQIGEGKSSDDAIKTAWGNGSLMVLTTGIIKLVLTTAYFVSYKLTGYDVMVKLFKKEIFLACLFGIGLSLLAMNSLIGIFNVPVAGIPALFALLMAVLPYSLYEKNYPNTPNQVPAQAIVTHKYFKYCPHIAFSLGIGVPLYYLMLAFPDHIKTGVETPEFFSGTPKMDLAGQLQCTDCKSNLLGAVTYAFLVFFGGYSVITQALSEPRHDEEEAAAGAVVAVGNPVALEQGSGNPQARLLSQDATPFVGMADQDIKFTLLFLDSACTLLTGLCGGLIQTTPYIGYTTYRELGAGRNYSIYIGFLFLVLAASGGMSYIAEAVPEPALKPIFVLIGVTLSLDVFGNMLHTNVVDDVVANKMRWLNQAIPAVIMAAFPAMADLMVINGNESVIVSTMASGFAWTSILWGQATLSIIRGEKVKAFLVFCLLALFTFFGVIHSWNGQVYAYPFMQDSYLPTSIFAGYLVTGVIGLFLIPTIPVNPEEENDKKEEKRQF